MVRYAVDIKRELERHPARSAWDKGVREYALELFDQYVEAHETRVVEKITEKDLLNGADDWSQYSYGGCAEIYDSDICERLCSPSEQKKLRYGDWHSHGEDWLDVQARALKQASRLVIHIANRR